MAASDPPVSGARTKQSQTSEFRGLPSIAEARARRGRLGGPRIWGWLTVVIGVSIVSW